MINQPPVVKSNFLSKILYKNHHMHACTDAKCEILAIKCHHCHPVLQSEILAIKSVSGTKMRISQTGCRRSSHAHMHTRLDLINQPAVLTCGNLAIKCHHCHPMLQSEILAIKSVSGTKLRMSQTDCR